MAVNTVYDNRVVESVIIFGLEQVQYYLALLEIPA